MEEEDDQEADLVPEDEEEEGYMQRENHALTVWYLPMIDRLCVLFET